MTFHLWQKHYEIPSCGSRDVISRYNPFITKISWCMTYHLLRRWLLRLYKGFGHYSLLSLSRGSVSKKGREGVNLNLCIRWKCWRGENTQVWGHCWDAGKPVLGKQKTVWNSLIRTLETSSIEDHSLLPASSPKVRGCREVVVISTWNYAGEFSTFVSHLIGVAEWEM